MRQLFAVFLFEILRDFNQVRAVVTVFRHLSLHPARLQITCLQRQRHVADLIARVIHIVFTRHVIARKFHQPRDGIAHRRAPGMARMQITGRIGRNIFDVHLQPLARVRTPVVFVFLQHDADHRRQTCALHKEIDEARTRDFTFGNRALLQIQMIDQLLRDHPRILPQLLCQPHRRIRRVIAVDLFLRDFDDDVAALPIQIKSLFHRVYDAGFEVCFNLIHASASLKNHSIWKRSDGCPASPISYATRQQSSVCSRRVVRLPISKTPNSV